MCYSTVRNQGVKMWRSVHQTTGGGGFYPVSFQELAPDFALHHPQAILRLQIQPKLGLDPEITLQPWRCVSGYASRFQLFGTVSAYSAQPLAENS